MTRFYKPKLVQVRIIPVIVYPDEGVEQFLSRQNPDSIRKHLERLYEQKGLENLGRFNIDILWENEGDLMTDVWMYSQLENECGALVDEKTFRNYRRDTRSGITAEHGLVMLGLEASHRGKLTLSEYLRSRPILPAHTTNGKRFFSRGRR